MKAPIFTTLAAGVMLILALIQMEESEHRGQVRDAGAVVHQCDDGWLVYDSAYQLEGCAVPAEVKMPHSADWNCGRGAHPLPCPATEPTI